MTTAVKRWTPARKIDLINDIRAGRITWLDAARRFGLSEEELKEWESRATRWGERGLRVTYVQEYREAEKPK